MKDQIQYLTEKRVSEISGIAVQTLRNYRFQRRGFPYSKIGRSVRYLLKDIVEYMDRHRIEPTEN